MSSTDSSKRRDALPGERTMAWQCPHCRAKGPAYYRNAGVDLIPCPHCKVPSLVVVGDLRECADFPAEVKGHATGALPPTEGHPDAPQVPKRKAPRPYSRTPESDPVLDALRAEARDDAAEIERMRETIASLRRWRSSVKAWAPVAAAAIVLIILMLSGIPR